MHHVICRTPRRLMLTAIGTAYFATACAPTVTLGDAYDDDPGEADAKTQAEDPAAGAGTTFDFPEPSQELCSTPSFIAGTDVSQALSQRARANLQNQGISEDQYEVVRLSVAPCEEAPDKMCERYEITLNVAAVLGSTGPTWNHETTFRFDPTNCEHDPCTGEAIKCADDTNSIYTLAQTYRLHAGGALTQSQRPGNPSMLEVSMPVAADFGGKVKPSIEVLREDLNEACFAGGEPSWVDQATSEPASPNFETLGFYARSDQNGGFESGCYYADLQGKLSAADDQYWAFTTTMGAYLDATVPSTGLEIPACAGDAFASQPVTVDTPSIAVKYLDETLASEGQLDGEFCPGERIAREFRGFACNTDQDFESVSGMTASAFCGKLEDVTYGAIASDMSNLISFSTLREWSRRTEETLAGITLSHAIARGRMVCPDDQTVCSLKEFSVETNELYWRSLSTGPTGLTFVVDAKAFDTAAAPPGAH